MGGNAFENLRRLERDEFEPYLAEVMGFLGEKFSKFKPVTYYRSKPNFGDLDILVQKPKLDRKEFEAWLGEKGVKEFHYNSDYVSFKYKDFQTDLIFVPEESFETANFYYSYNDLNNLVGRVAHKFGLKFGWDGLSYCIRTESGHDGRRLTLSKSPREIYNFLGLDYSKWEKGFDELEEIFEFVTSTPFFNPDIFNYEELNHQNRTRYKKRNTYRLFLKWLEERPDLPKYQYFPDKSVYLPKIHNAFKSSNILGELIQYAEDMEAYQKRAAKFNGYLVREWTGLEGKDLGKAIENFKLYIGKAYPEYGDPLSVKFRGSKLQPFDNYLDSGQDVSYNFANWFLFKYLPSLNVDKETFKSLPVYRFVFSDSK